MASLADLYLKCFSDETAIVYMVPSNCNIILVLLKERGSVSGE